MLRQHTSTRRPPRLTSTPTKNTHMKYDQTTAPNRNKHPQTHNTKYSNTHRHTMKTPDPGSNISHVAGTAGTPSPYHRTRGTSSATHGAAMVSNIPTTHNPSSKPDPGGSHCRSVSNIPTSSDSSQHANAEPAGRHDELLHGQRKQGSSTRRDDDPQADPSGQATATPTTNNPPGPESPDRDQAPTGSNTNTSKNYTDSYINNNLLYTNHGSSTSHHQGHGHKTPRNT